MLYAWFERNVKTVSKLKKSPPLDVVIHCEGPEYEKALGALDEQLTAAGLKTRLIAVSSNRLGYSQLNSRDLVEIKPDGVRDYLSSVSAKVFLTTTPGLGVLDLRRPRNCSLAAHVMHSASDIHFYAPFSFSLFDVVYGCGGYQKKSLDWLASIRSQDPRPKFVKTGLPHMDELPRLVKLNDSASRVLVAPTWGYRLKDLNLTRVLEQQSLDAHSIVFRPHPQSWLSEPEFIERVMTTAPCPVEIDDSASPDLSMARCGTLMTDISSIAFDFRRARAERDGRIVQLHDSVLRPDCEGVWIPWSAREVRFFQEGCPESIFTTREPQCDSEDEDSILVEGSVSRIVVDVQRRISGGDSQGRVKEQVSRV